MKYIRLFPSASIRDAVLAEIKHGVISYTEGEGMLMKSVAPLPPNDEIWYTSTDGNVIEPATVSGFNVNIVSNTYRGGKGVIKFDGEVTSVGRNTFRQCNTLYSITLPDSVISIGNRCFYNSKSLTSITIPNRVTTISDYIFYGCTSLTSITIPDSITSIGNRTFYGCTNLTSIILPHSLTTIGDYAFLRCTGLTCITIPDNVTSIGSYAFAECTGLASIIIPSGVISIGYCIFSDCTKLGSIVVDPGNQKYDSRDNCNAIIETGTNTLVAGCKNTVIPNTVTTIGVESFHGQTGLTNITIPNSVTLIDTGAFNSCRGLVTLTVPNTVQNIYAEAFYDVPNVIYTGSAGGRPWGAHAINGCVDGDFVYAENEKENLVDYLGTNTSIKIPDKVITLNDRTFIHIKDDITSIDFGNGLHEIPEYMFASSINKESNLTHIIIGTDILSIGECAFCGCLKMNSIICNATTPPTLGEGVFDETNNCPIYVPSGSVEAYKAATNWSTYADRIQAIPDAA